MSKEKEIVEEAAPVKASDARKNFLALIKAYKKSNPVKAAAKKAEFERKLASL